MTLKQKALLQTLGLFLAIISISLITNVILFYTPLEVLKYVAILGLVIFLFYSMYGVVLSRLEYKETCKNISSKT